MCDWVNKAEPLDAPAAYHQPFNQPQCVCLHGFLQRPHSPARSIVFTCVHQVCGWQRIRNMALALGLHRLTHTKYQELFCFFHILVKRRRVTLRRSRSVMFPCVADVFSGRSNVPITHWEAGASSAEDADASSKNLCLFTHLSCSSSSINPLIN